MICRHVIYLWPVIVGHSDLSTAATHISRKDLIMFSLIHMCWEEMCRIEIVSFQYVPILETLKTLLDDDSVSKEYKSISQLNYQ